MINKLNYGKVNGDFEELHALKGFKVLAVGNGTIGEECALRIMLMNENNVAVDLSITDDGAYREYSVGCYIKVFDEDEEKHWLDRQYGYLEWDRYSNGHGGCSLYKVTAWMPLPKLYKG